MRFDFEQLFDEDYLYFYSVFHTPEVNEAQANKVAALLGLTPEMQVLDVPCGYGRISNQLARLGYKVSGMDNSPLFLAKANEDAHALGVNVSYFPGDMRKLPIEDAQFDAVVNWFTSFGYFEDDENRAVLQEFRRVLKPGGKLLIEHINRDRMLANFRPAHLTEIEGNLMVDSAAFDPIAGRTINERFIVRNGKTKRSSYSVRVFTASEIVLWLENAGFENIQITDAEGAPFGLNSTRMAAVATRAH